MTPAEFKEKYPAFADEDDDVVEAAIDDADPFFDQARWGELYSVGLGLFVAHTLSVNNADAEAGSTAADATTEQVTKSVGGVSVTTRLSSSTSSSGVDFSADPYMRTTYGQRYKHLARLVGLGVTVT